MKILTVLTGGTIGSTVKNKTIDVKGFSCPITEMYKEKFPGTADFDAVNLCSVLSENINYRHWNSLTDCILDGEKAGYDGIIVTHGSDTLSYTSAILGVCLSFIKIPIVLTAADYPLENPKSNGFLNFCGAVEFIKSVNAPGVYVSYGTGEQADIYLGTRLCEADRFLDRFSDFTGTPLGRYCQGKVTLNQSPFNPTPEQLMQRRSPILQGVPRLSDCVKMITPYPGIDYSRINLSPKIKAILHLSYHSGTLCTEGGSTALDLLKQCKENGVDFYLCSIKNRENLYATTRKLLADGGVPMYNISREAAFAKLTAVYSSDCANPTEVSGKNFFFENVFEFR